MEPTAAARPLQTLLKLTGENGKLGR